MNELPAAVISQRLREGDRAAAFIPELRSPWRQRSEPELREWHALLDLLLSGAVAPRKVFLLVDELYDSVKGDWSQALQSPGIQECELYSFDLESSVRRAKEVLGDGKPDWAIRLALSLAKSSAHKLVLRGFLTQGMFMAFSQALRFNRTLQHLDVDLYQVTGTAWVSSILDYNSTLHTLILHCWCTSLLEPLASSLLSNTTLRHLRLVRRMLDSPSRTEKEVLFFNALGRNRGLRSFAQFEEVLARDSCQALADALATNPTLVEVDLSFGSRLGFQIVVERGLLASNNIVGLNLWEMTDPFTVCPDLLARVMAEKPIRRLELFLTRDITDAPLLAMPTTNHLVELKIFGTRVGQAWRALADVVKRSASLRNLHVTSYGSRDSIPDTSLFCAIAKHPFLEEFYVKGIHCTVELAEIVKTHPSLTTIGCYIASVAEAQALIAAAKANPRLLKVKHRLRWVSHDDHEFREKVKPIIHVLHSYLEMNRHGRHKLLIEHPFLLADLLGSVIDFRTRINLVMENPEPLIQAIHSRSFDVATQSKHMASKKRKRDRPVLSLE